MGTNERRRTTRAREVVILLVSFALIIGGIYGYLYWKSLPTTVSAFFVSADFMEGSWLGRVGGIGRTPRPHHQPDLARDEERDLTQQGRPVSPQIIRTDPGRHADEREDHARKPHEVPAQ